MHPRASMRRSSRGGSKHGRSSILHRVAEHTWDQPERAAQVPLKKSHWDSVQDWESEERNPYGRYYGSPGGGSNWNAVDYETTSEVNRIPRPSERLRLAMQYNEVFHDNPYYEPPPIDNGREAELQTHEPPNYGAYAVETSDDFFADEQSFPIDFMTSTPSAASIQRKGLDIVNPSTGQKIVVTQSSVGAAFDAHRWTGTTTDPLTTKRAADDKKVTITDPKTGESLIVKKTEQGSKFSATSWPIRFAQAPPFVPKHLKPEHAVVSAENDAGLPDQFQPSQTPQEQSPEWTMTNAVAPSRSRKLDIQSLTDLANEHHRRSNTRDKPTSVPSPDSMSMDDTLGPSDEEKEPSRLSRRHTGQSHPGRFRSRSASPRLYHFLTPSNSPLVPVQPKRTVFSEDMLRSLNVIGTQIPTPLLHPKLVDILVMDPEDYIARCERRRQVDDFAGEYLEESGHDLGNRAEEPFTPVHQRQSRARDDAVIRKITGILNKLTPEKYEPLLQSMYGILDHQSTQIHEGLLERIIGEVHECALNQPSYSEMYAVLCSNICTRIHGNEEKATGYPAREVSNHDVLENFRRILLNKCQAQFTDGLELIHAKPVASDAEAQQNENDCKSRQRTKGNVKFIGELFKWSMLSERIMHKVIKKLLLDITHTGAATADALEILCTLMHTAGKELDHPKAADYMTHYFNRLEYISKTHPVPRIRFLVLDVIALRQNGWVERRKDPKVVPISPAKDGSEQGGAKVSTKGQISGRSKAETSHQTPPDARRPTQLQSSVHAISMGSLPCRADAPVWYHASSDSFSTPGVSPVSSVAPDPSLYSFGVRDTDGKSSSQRFIYHALADGRLNMTTEEDLRLEAKAQMMLDEWHITGQNIGNVLAMIDDIPIHSLHQFWVSALEFATRTNKYERYRANLVLLIEVFIHHGRLAAPSVVGSIMGLIDRACSQETWIESPGIWYNLAGMIAELMDTGIVVFDHLSDMCSPFFQHQQDGPCREFLIATMHAIQNVDGRLYNPQVAYALYQVVGALGMYQPRLWTVADFIAALAY